MWLYLPIAEEDRYQKQILKDKKLVVKENLTTELNKNEN